MRGVGIAAMIGRLGWRSGSLGAQAQRVLLLGAVALVTKACRSFVHCGQDTLARSRCPQIAARARGFGAGSPSWDVRTEDLEAERRFYGRDPVYRDVQISDIRDLNDLMRLADPLRPGKDMELVAITLDDGTEIKLPTVKDLKKCKPSEVRPITLTWKDYREAAEKMKSPQEYDEIIKRLLNAGNAEMQDMVKQNWKYFDKTFYFRLTELIEDATDPLLKEKLQNLNKYTIDVLQVAKGQVGNQHLEEMQDAQKILDAFLEDGVALWPPTAAGWARLAQEVELRAMRKGHQDGWFETMIEACERFGMKAQREGSARDVNAAFLEYAKAAIERLVTEWLRHDSLWEETGEGQFIYKLMSLHQKQWRVALQQEVRERQVPLDAYKIREEIKIISETKVMTLPMGSKIQLYAAQYLQGLIDFINKENDLLVNSARFDSDSG